MSAFKIVPALPSHSKEIGEIKAGNWLEQYANLPGVTPEWIANEVERIAGEAGNLNRAGWIKQSALPDAKNFWRVALDSKTGAVAGYVEARKLDDGTQSLCSLHLKPEYRGMRLGQALMDAAHKWLSPYADTYLEVAAVNKEAQKFYERNNYRLTGKKFVYESVVDMREMQLKALARN